METNRSYSRDEALANQMDDEDRSHVTGPREPKTQKERKQKKDEPEEESDST